MELWEFCKAIQNFAKWCLPLSTDKKGVCIFPWHLPKGLGKKKRKKKDQSFDAGKLVLESLSRTNQSIPQSDFLYKKVLAEQQKNGIEWRFVYFYHHAYPQRELTMELNGEALKEKNKSTICLEKV